MSPKNPKTALAGALATFLLAASAAPALAASSPTQLSTVLVGGALSISLAPASVSDTFTLNGADHAEDQAVTLEPSDLTGTGDGWNVTVSSSPLETSGGTVVPSTWSLSLNGSSTSASASTSLVASDNGPGTYTLPSGNNVTYPVAVPGTSGGTPTPAMVYSAQAGSGLGEFKIPGDLWLSVPANAEAGTYSATLTWTIAQGPTPDAALVPAASGLTGYSWAASDDLVATASSYYQTDVPANAFDNNTSTYWYSAYENYSYSSCTSSGTWIEAQWQGLAQFSQVYIYTDNGSFQTETWTFYICGSTNGGSTWSEIGSATLNVPSSPMTELPIAVNNGSYNALRIDMVLPSNQQPLIDEVTIN